MKIPEKNAFTINYLNNSFFPFSFAVSKKGDVIDAFICAQSVINICDIIENNVNNNLIIFDVDHTKLDNSNQLLSLRSIASYAGVQFSLIDSETIVIAKESLKPLLTDLYHYNFTTIDIGNEWNETEVIHHIITCKEYDWQTEVDLSKLPASQNFIHSHDDCYLSIKTYNPSFVIQIFTKTLQIFVGTVLAETSNEPIDISEIPEEILMQFWEEDFGLTILRKTTQVTRTGLKMGVAKKSYSFGEKSEYHPEFWIRYEAVGQHWHIEK